MIRSARGQVQSEAMTRQTARWGVYAWNLLMLVWLAFGLGLKGQFFAPIPGEETFWFFNPMVVFLGAVLATTAAGNITLATLWLVSPKN